MMRSILIALMLSGSAFILSGTVYAQSAPDTRQTDQSEEDWRKSKKKSGTSTEDIIDIIENTRGSGVGNGRGFSPVDALPEESRRHLMKERAKRMALAGPDEPVDVSFTPSEAAISDLDLENQEKAAWEELAKSMNGTTQGPLGQGQGGQGQTQGQQGQQGSGQSSDTSDQAGSSRSVMRGGSAASVSDILSRIKGTGLGSGAQGNQEQGQSGQSAQAQSAQDETPSQQNEQAQNLSQLEGQAQGKTQLAAKGQSQAEAVAQTANRAPEAASPLDRIKDVQREQNTSGSRSSASDFLKKDK